MSGTGDSMRIIAKVISRANSKPKCSGCGKPRPGYDRMPQPREFEFIPIWNIPVALSYTTDVMNAAYEEADCLMLSGETSVGRYPERFVEAIVRIASRIERSGGHGFGLLRLHSHRARLPQALADPRHPRLQAALRLEHRGNHPARQRAPA